MANKRRNSRRANNEGSIFQRKDGRWSGALTIGYDENGHQKKKIVYGKTRTEVEAKLGVYDTRLKTNTFSKLEDSTVAELMREWLVVFKRNSVMPRTFQSDMEIFKLHIEPYVRNLYIHELDDITIQRIINKMIEKNYSLSMVKKTKFIFNQFLDYCELSKWIPFNPARKVKVRIKDKKVYSGQAKYKALTPDQRIEFLQLLNEDPRNYLKPLCYTLMFGGLRIGEALGIQWKDINFENKTISINKASTLNPTFDNNGNVISRKTQIGETKTAGSNRLIPIPDMLVQTLKEWHENQRIRSLNENKKLANPTTYVFCDDDGNLKTYSSCRLTFNRFKKFHKIRDWKICFHGLRHTFSNMLFEMNENPKVIQQLLGHKDVRTTITVYNSVDQDYLRQSTNKLNDKFNQDILSAPTKPTPKEQILDNLKNYELEQVEDIDEMIKQLEELKAKKKAKEKDFEM